MTYTLYGTLVSECKLLTRDGFNEVMTTDQISDRYLKSPISFRFISFCFPNHDFLRSNYRRFDLATIGKGNVD